MAAMKRVAWLPAVDMKVPRAVVQPRAGGYSELVEATGGGLLYEPNDAGALARAIRSLLEDPERARALGVRGREGLASGFTVRDMARRMTDLYEKLVGERGAGVPAPRQGEAR